MPAVSVRADLMPKEIRREVSRLEKEPTSGIRLPIFLPHTHPWLVGWTSLGLGQLWPGVSVVLGAHASQTRPGPASAPSLCLFWPARISKEPSYASEGGHNREEPFYAVTQTHGWAFVPHSFFPGWKKAWLKREVIERPILEYDPWVGVGDKSFFSITINFR